MSTTIGNLAVILSANAAGFTAGFATASRTATGFVGTIGTMVKSVGAMAGVVGVAESIKSAFTGFAAMESSEVAFETLLGSGEKARTLMADLAKFGAETPFQLPELTAAGKNLAAFGMSADAIVPKLRQIGDISSLLNQPIGEMATLYGKAKVAGVLMSEDINQFTERGVPLIQTLAAQFGVAEVQIKKMASEGKISFAHLDQAIGTLTSNGGRFAGGMAKQAETISGKWSTLSDNVGMTMTKIGESVVKEFNLKGGLDAFIGFTGTIQESIGSLKPLFDGLVYAFDAVKAVGMAAWEGLSLGAQAVGATVSMIFQGMAGETTTFGDLFREAMLSVQFTFENFGALWELGWENMKLAGAIFFNDAVHLFTVNIPEVLGWFSRNWKAVFTDVYELTVTIFTNIGKNIWNFFKNIPGLIAGTTSFGEIWTPLTEGFKSSIQEALVVTKRDFTQWEKDQVNRISELNAALGQKKDAFFTADNIKRSFADGIIGGVTEAATVVGADKFGIAGILSGTVGGVPKPGSPGAAVVNAVKERETARAGAFEVGSKDAYNAVIRSRDSQMSAAKDTAKNTKDTVKAVDAVKTAIESLAGGAMGLGSLNVGGG